MILDQRYLHSARSEPHSDRIRNRSKFLETVSQKNGKGLFVLVSPAYELSENSARDMGNVLLDAHKNVKISRVPYRHDVSGKMTVAHLCAEARGLDLIVYLSNQICDKFEQSLPNKADRHGHEITEAVAVAHHLKRPLVIAHLSNCEHSHEVDIERYRKNLSGNLDLLYIGGSTVRQ